MRSRTIVRMRRKLLAGMAGMGVGIAVVLGLELGLWAAIEAEILEMAHPGGGTAGIWQGQHPEFGVWHAPNLEARHTSRCFDVAYRINSVGARDRERSHRAAGFRAVVLGDSFTEGWGVEEPARLSNLLETATGIEHLNFAMAHFGTYQELLLYQKLASQYDHEMLLVGIVPANDFLDIDYDTALEMSWYEHRYRPYLVGVVAPYSHLDHIEPGWRRWLRLHSHTFHAVRLALRNQALRSAGPAPSRFYEFSEAGARRLETILGMLVEAARGKRIALILMPTAADLQDYTRSPGPDPLSVRLARWASDRNVHIVNLLSAMANDMRRAEGYFHPCDFHWSALGNRVAADYVLSALRTGFYASEGDPDQG